jgi:hypothetical protein
MIYEDCLAEPAGSAFSSMKKCPFAEKGQEIGES